MFLVFSLSFSSIFLFPNFFFSFVLSFFLFFSSSFSFFFLFFFQSSEQMPKPTKHRREVPVVKKTIFCCENLIFGPRWTGKREGVRKGPFEGDFPFLFLQKKKFLLFLFSCISFKQVSLLTFSIRDLL